MNEQNRSDSLLEMARGAILEMMTKINLCDTCLHHAVCRQGIAQQWGRMADCLHYERLILMGHTPGLLPLWVRTATPPEEDET